MKNIQKRFRVEQARNPLLSSLVNFSSAVKGQRYSAAVIGLYFQKLVDRDDYDELDEEDILAYLVKLSNSERV